MTATFLLEVELTDVSSLNETAEDIADAVAGAGVAITSVKPWARPSQTTAMPVPSGLGDVFQPPTPPA